MDRAARKLCPHRLAPGSRVPLASSAFAAELVSRDAWDAQGCSQPVRIDSKARTALRMPARSGGCAHRCRSEPSVWAYLASWDQSEALIPQRSNSSARTSISLDPPALRFRRLGDAL